MNEKSAQKEMEDIFVKSQQIKGKLIKLGLRRGKAREEKS
jgi:hypothetical protein